MHEGGSSSPGLCTLSSSLSGNFSSADQCQSHIQEYLTFCMLLNVQVNGANIDRTDTAQRASNESNRL
ncbi:hypothetical protein AZE42_11626 [Rhizopogon vesiculosus]|uniref:Uncharacterized protein n=1 Tax=Rhizopogon vesiculosus TaxID=180088 RepID=A0A1J8Q7Y9_9AGAM|nr:hypothetical protein AZE42_11626 [Rhizopogon vesiculosus]